MVSHSLPRPLYHSSLTDHGATPAVYKPTTTAHYAIAPPTATLSVDVVPREGRNPLALWERVRVRVRRGMQRNATECNCFKGSPLLATPDEAKLGHLGTPHTSERCAKRGHPGLIFSLYRRSKPGQTRPNEATYRKRRFLAPVWSPRPLGEGQVRVRARGMSGNERKINVPPLLRTPDCRRPCAHR